MLGELALHDFNKVVDVPRASGSRDTRGNDRVRQLLAVIRIETPATTHGFGIISNEYAKSAALLLVEVAHQQTRFAGGIALELRARAQEHR